MCISGQSKGWFGYSALLAAVTGWALPTETTTFATVDELVHIVLRDSKTLFGTLQSSPTNLRYKCVVCDKTINSIKTFMNDIAGPRNDWQRPVSQSVAANNRKYIAEYRHQ